MSSGGVGLPRFPLPGSSAHGGDPVALVRAESLATAGRCDEGGAEDAGRAASPGDTVLAGVQSHG